MIFRFEYLFQTTLSLSSLKKKIFFSRSLPLGCRILQKSLAILPFPLPSSLDSKSIRDRDSTRRIIKTCHCACMLFSMCVSAMKSFAYLHIRHLLCVSYVPGIADVLVVMIDEWPTPGACLLPGTATQRAGKQMNNRVLSPSRKNTDDVTECGW